MAPVPPSPEDILYAKIKQSTQGVNFIHAIREELTLSRDILGEPPAQLEFSDGAVAGRHFAVRERMIASLPDKERKQFEDNRAATSRDVDSLRSEVESIIGKEALDAKTKLRVEKINKALKNKPDDRGYLEMLETAREDTLTEMLSNTIDKLRAEAAAPLVADEKKWIGIITADKGLKGEYEALTAEAKKLADNKIDKKDRTAMLEKWDTRYVRWAEAVDTHLEKTDKVKDGQSSSVRSTMYKELDKKSGLSKTRSEIGPIIAMAEPAAKPSFAMADADEITRPVTPLAAKAGTGQGWGSKA